MGRRSEQERFWTHVVKGPGPQDCWLWVGAIADDGYGRFWLSGGEAGRTVRPQRYAYGLVAGQAVAPDTMVLHACDVPLCVHADADPEISHLRPGTARENMQDRARRGRQPRESLQFDALPRAERARRARALRAVVLERGWDAAAIHAVLSGNDAAQPTLW